MNKLISICIPTYQRPQLLKEALESCFAQQYEPIEIIIGDDSKDDATEELVRELQTRCGYRLRYVRNNPSLGQAGNVNRLFEMVEGDRLVLLHDDDLLLPNALSDLDKCWKVEPGIIAAFGKQYLISMTGEVLYQQSDQLNRTYYRTAEREGLQHSAMVSALLQQFPNNGYMLLSSAARHTRYRDESEIGTNRWCDFDFGIRLASTFDDFYFLAKYTSQYRLTDISVSCQGNPVYMYPMIEAMDVGEYARWAKEKALNRLAPLVVHNYAVSGHKLEALRILTSKNYTFNRRFSLQGIYHFIIIFCPNFKSVFTQAKSILN